MEERTREMQIVIMISFASHVRASQCYASLPMQFIEAHRQVLIPSVINAQPTPFSRG